MKDLSKDLQSITDICHKLRVPELKYLQEFASPGDRPSPSQVIIHHLHLPLSDLGNGILELLKDLGDSPQVAAVNNLAFILDRTFDVWLRKNHFPESIAEILTKWRFSIFSALLYQQKVFELDGKHSQQIIESLVDLLETIAFDCKGWSPVPERSKYFLLDQLTSVSNKVLCNPHSDLSHIDQAGCEWLAYRAKEQAKFVKVSERLVNLEAQQCWKRFSYWCAQTYIDRLFSGNKVPDSLQVFLDLHWVSAVAESLSVADESSIALDPEINTLTLEMKQVFCVQGEALFKYADSLVDDLKGKLVSLNLSYDESLFNDIEASIVSLLKQELSSSFSMYSSIPTDSSIAAQFSHFDLSRLVLNSDSLQKKESPVDYGLKVNDWYQLFSEVGEASPMTLVAYFKYAGTFLFANYLGMKAALYTRDEMEELIRSKSLRPYRGNEPFTTVLSACLKGLSRVADTQQKARIAAAQKAKEEAEKLLEAQRLAEEAVEKRAAEAAERAKLLLKKQEDKLKAERHSKALVLIQQLSIGAWVSLCINDCAAERYKLVVKIAASGKFIFVDRLGIKKKEFKETDLVELVISSKIEFLSDGAEFEDSLQRVVSRLRMEK